MNNIRPFQGIVPTVNSSCYIDPLACVIGKVSLLDDSSMWPYSVARGDVNLIHIGKGTNIQDHCLLHTTHDSKYNPGGIPLIIGEKVTVGHHSVLHACTIESLCLIGIGATILDGAVVKENTFVAAGSLVPPGKTLESGYLWMGSPAKKQRKLSKKEIEFIEYSANNYIQLKNSYQL